MKKGANDVRKPRERTPQMVAKAAIEELVEMYKEDFISPPEKGLIEGVFERACEEYPFKSEDATQPPKTLYTVAGRC